MKWEEKNVWLRNILSNIWLIVLLWRIEKQHLFLGRHGRFIFIYLQKYVMDWGCVCTAESWRKACWLPINLIGRDWLFLICWIKGGWGFVSEPFPGETSRWNFVLMSKCSKLEMWRCSLSFDMHRILGWWLASNCDGTDRGIKLDSILVPPR